MTEDRQPAADSAPSRVCRRRVGRARDEKRWRGQVWLACLLLSSGINLPAARKQDLQLVTIYDFHRGTAPLLISIPHSGTQVPAQMLRRFSSIARELPDTDWYVDQLYAFARGMLYGDRKSVV